MTKQVTDKYCIRRIGTEKDLLTFYKAEYEKEERYILSKSFAHPIWAVNSKEEASWALKNDIPIELCTYEKPCHEDGINPDEYEIVRQRVTIEIDKVIV